MVEAQNAGPDKNFSSRNLHRIFSCRLDAAPFSVPPHKISRNIESERFSA